MADTARNAETVVPHDTDVIPPTLALYVGGAGDLKLRARGSNEDAVFVSVPAGSILPVQACYVRATGTTATDIVALY